MAKKNRKRLSLNLDVLFPGKTIEIGDTPVEIKPLSVLQLVSIGRQLRGFGKVLSKENVTWDNYNTTEGITNIALVLMEQFPEVLEEVTDIEMDDILQLPIPELVKLVECVIDVNLESKEELMGNLTNLAEKLGMMVPKEENQTSPEQSKSSSETDTPGQV